MMELIQITKLQVASGAIRTVSHICTRILRSNISGVLALLHIICKHKETHFKKNLNPMCKGLH